MERIARIFLWVWANYLCAKIFGQFPYSIQTVEGHQKFQGVEDFKCLNFVKDAVKLKVRGGEGYKPKPSIIML